MSTTIEVTVDDDTSVGTVNRVIALNGFTEENVEHFRQLATSYAELQNQQQGWIEKKGKTEVVLWPVGSVKRIKTREEKAAQKAKYNKLRNRLADVKEKRRLAANTPEAIKKRRLANEDPEKKKKKSDSAKQRRLTLKIVSEKDPEIYKQCRADANMLLAKQDLKVEEELFAAEEKMRKEGAFGCGTCRRDQNVEIVNIADIHFSEEESTMEMSDDNKD